MDVTRVMSHLTSKFVRNHNFVNSQSLHWLQFINVIHMYEKSVHVINYSIEYPLKDNIQCNMSRKNRKDIF